jgi:hypothetical protein
MHEDKTIHVQLPETVKLREKQEKQIPKGPRHSSGCYSPASHRDGPGSNPGLVMWDFVMNKSGPGAGFLPLPICIPSASPQSSSLSPEAGTIGQEWPQCQEPHKPNKIRKNRQTYGKENTSQKGEKLYKT